MSTRIPARHPFAAVAAVAVTAAALPLLGTQTATAQTTARPSDAASTVRPGLFLTVSGSEDTWIRGVRLLCEPAPHGRHPRAAEACTALDRAGGDLDALPDATGPCTMEYDPVTVSAEGRHRGERVAWKKTFPNTCTMRSATGPVFDF
ncbi:subtilase-type protease inhibitor [Streptomyces tubbatahanensis]|uniref:Subtilase-type protease inhibitor n=1 Tax=Streptomyces tubbatahanensis TaxID=2923272 RepID=A0ABY3XPI4_9ACTN|nr:SSI family serine proteinase inhibitor [Streptomyces tubbatahanensis]UNS96344.1 subtilase-type protease inhibitor [Streptomyces tubbatahanensis]